MVLVLKGAKDSASPENIGFLSATVSGLFFNVFSVKINTYDSYLPLIKQKPKHLAWF